MKPGLLIFDLDGVLIDSKDVHYFALNKSLELIDSTYMISIEEHLKEFDGLTTHEKLKKLSVKKVCQNKNLMMFGNISKFSLKNYSKT
jgi:beta-phosphoglucomutase-like phosphatase (HAD superfamily)